MKHPAVASRHGRSKTIGMRSLQLIILAAALGILLPQFRIFLASLHLLGEADWWWAVIAVWAVGFSYMAAGYIYVFLVRRDLPVGWLMAVQVASAFTNRLLPNGLGNVTLNARFLHRQGLAAAQATTVALTNQSLGFCSLVLIIGGLWLRDESGLRRIIDGYLQWWYVLVLVCTVLGGIYIFDMLTASSRLKISRFLRESAAGLRGLAAHPFRFAAALACSVAITLAHALCLYASIRAVGVIVSFEQAVLVYVAGAALASAAPTPGGLGAVEAALVATLTAVGLDAGNALVAAFMYRLASLWLPLLPGFLMFRLLRINKVI